MATYHASRDSRYRSSNAAHRPSVPLKRSSLSQYGIDTFDHCQTIRGSIGEQYLMARGAIVPPEEGHLRFHPALKHPTAGYSGPALVALVTHAETRAPLTLHRTWIQPDGRKAQIEPSRMLLGGHQKRHGVIRLWPDDAVTTGLCVAEGIETALSVAHDYTPVWSCIDAGNLADLPVLAGIEVLVIAADHDEAGIAAADTCADRWTAAEVDVRVIAPDVECSDWNDSRRAA